MNNLLVRLIAPFAIWFLHFSVLYAAHAGLCSVEQTGDAQWTVTVLATIAATGAIIAVLAMPLRDVSERVAVALASGLGLLAVIWTALPALLLKACL